MDAIITNMFITAWNELMKGLFTMLTVAGSGYILFVIFKKKVPEWFKLWTDADEKRHKNVFDELRVKSIIDARHPVFGEKEKL